MSVKPVSVAVMADQSNYVPVGTNPIAAYTALLGQYAEFADVDVIAGVITTNTEFLRTSVLVYNGSGVDILPGMALNWVTGFWGTQVQACPIGQVIRCYAPSYNNGNTTNVFPSGSFFYAVKAGPMAPLSDGTAIAINDGLVVGAVAGKVKTNYGIGGGEVYSSVAASTAVTATTVPTKFDQNYTFPANSLQAGTTIRIIEEAIVTAANSTDTLTLDLMIGATVVATTGAIDVVTNDVFEFVSEIEVRTAGASGTIVATTIVNTATGSATFKPIALASTAIDTTATQQVAVRATWSTNNAGNSVRQDVLNISRFTASGAISSSGIATAAAALGSAVQFRAMVNCQW